jgi:Flp pilus assembly protein TadG
MSNTIRQTAVKARAFLRAKRGNVAMMFALAIVPLVIAAGTGLDITRAMLVRQQMGEALDAAALAVGSTTGLDQAAAQALAQKYFDANYTVDKTAFGTPTVIIPASGYTSTGSVVMTASDPMPTILMQLAGFTTLPVTATSTVVWGQSKLWVALVLDNSGSMASSNKLTGLKNASAQLLTTLQNASSTAGDVQVGIVPFSNTVNVGASNSGASWIDWTDWAAAPTDASGTAIKDGYTITKTNVVFDAYGPGDDCPFTTTDPVSGAVASDDPPFGFACQQTSTNNAGAVTVVTSGGKKYSAIPAAGLCPSLNAAAYNHAYRDHLARYYNGCWTMTKVVGSKIQVSSGSGATCGGFVGGNCSCTNNICKTQKWKHTWVPNNHNTWGGCIMDRAQNYDIQNTQPSGASGFSAANPVSCLSSTVTPLGYNWSTLNSQITAMNANGSTNQSVGLAHGWQMLTPGNPYGTPSVPANTARYVIILSDGRNTQDRWWGDGQEGTSDDNLIDARMDQVCAAVKADGGVVYSIFVNTGNQPTPVALQNCATDSSKYFALTSASEIVTAFNQIAQQITAVRVNK